MTAMMKKNTFRPGEFKARLPYLDKIPTHILLGRLELGVSRTLAMATAAAATPCQRLAGIGELAKAAQEVYKADTRALIAACNFSASQVAKELKNRGVAIPK